MLYVNIFLEYIYTSRQSNVPTDNTFGILEITIEFHQNTGSYRTVISAKTTLSLSIQNMPKQNDFTETRMTS